MNNFVNFFKLATLLGNKIDFWNRVNFTKVGYFDIHTVDFLKMNVFNSAESQISAAESLWMYNDVTANWCDVRPR